MYICCKPLHHYFSGVMVKNLCLKSGGIQVALGRDSWCVDVAVWLGHCRNESHDSPKEKYEGQVKRSVISVVEVVTHPLQISINLICIITNILFL